jgi:hypothetical protein
MASEAPAAAAGGLSEGRVIDGFLLEERTHQGGMASLWRVSRTDATPILPLIMKVPRIRGGDDPTSIVGSKSSR